MNLKKLGHQMPFHRSVLIGAVFEILFIITFFQVLADTESGLINKKIDKLEKELVELKKLLKEKKAEAQEMEV